MTTPADAAREWYTNRLHNYLSAVYLAHLATDQGGPEPAVLYPKDTELGNEVKRVSSRLPKEVREALAFYKARYTDQDIGSAVAYRVPSAPEETYAVRVTTDGDDGYLEVYDTQGTFLAAGRTNLEIIAWGGRDWLREQAERPGELPPELADSSRQTLWGRPIEGRHCCETTRHRCRSKPPGRCDGAIGHVATDGSPHHCHDCGRTWGGDPERATAVAAEIEARKPPKVDPWSVQVTYTDGETWDQELLMKDFTVRTDAGPVTVPVGDIFQIDFAPRGRRDKVPPLDVITTATSKVTGTLEGERLRVGPDWRETTPEYASVRRIVKRVMVTYQDAAGSRLELRLLGRTDGSVTGSGPYATTSCVATAAVHAGLLRPGEVGTVRVEVLAPMVGFTASTANGITTETWEDCELDAFRFVD